MKDPLANIKVAPNSKESEMMVLGCMLTSINALNIAADSLSITDFYFSEHRTIFETLQECYQEDKPADIHIIAEQLKIKKKLKSVGGVSYITLLAQYAGTAAYIDEYCTIVKDKSVLRQMIYAAQKVEKEALENPPNVHSMLDQAQHLFFKIGQEASSGVGTLISDILSGKLSKENDTFLKVLQHRQENYQAKGPDETKITGIPTHFADLDKLINGLNNSHLNILAARPAMGKTALALNIAENVCFKNNTPVGIFSLEMTAEQLVHRVVSSQSQVESEKIRTGSLNGAEYQRVVSTVHSIQDHVMVIDDQPGLKITDLRARARRMKETYNIGLLVIDYLQLISSSGNYRSTENRQIEISEISRLLKTLARELNIPIVCLSQLSRKVEERQGHRPMMSDLRESGSIEQDSDIVMFLLRRDYYDPLDKPGLAELIIAKNRHGAIGNITLTFRKEFAQFANYTPLNYDASSYKVEDNKAFNEFSPLT